MNQIKSLCEPIVDSNPLQLSRRGNDLGGIESQNRIGFLDRMEFQCNYILSEAALSNVSSLGIITLEITMISIDHYFIRFDISRSLRRLGQQLSATLINSQSIFLTCSTLEFRWLNAKVKCMWIEFLNSC